MPEITVRELRSDRDRDGLIEFLSATSVPYHVGGQPTAEAAAARVDSGRFWSDESIGLWIEADGERVGVVTIDDLDDVADGGNPVFDLRFADAHRGRGLAVPVLATLTKWVFGRWPTVQRFEGHTRVDNEAMRAAFRGAGWVKEACYRDAWPVAGAQPLASVTYAVLRRDWESGTTTPVVWDEPAATAPDRHLTAREVIDQLDLAAHPEGGHYRQTWRDDPGDGSRGVASSIYYLLAAGERSHWHRVDAAEVWLYHGGAPLTLRISPDAATAPTDFRLGLDLAAGEQPQAVVPMGWWQAAEPSGAWTLVGCTVAPAFEFAGFELAAPGFEPGRNR